MSAWLVKAPPVAVVDLLQWWEGDIPLLCCECAEVVEVFISSDLQDSPHYFEIELSPFNALYVSKIFNPFLNGAY